MRQLTGIDTSFLNIETGPVYGHVSSLGLYDPSTAGEALTVERVRERLASRMHLLPAIRAKLVEVPFNLDHPYWVDDAAFDIADHVYEVGLAAPGTRAQLHEVVARLVAKPLDRSRPLWEMAVITGLNDNMVAVLHTMHHSFIDGGSATNMLAVMLDTDPTIDPVTPPPVPWQPEPEPEPLALLTAAMTANALRPLKAVKMQWDMLTHLAKQSPPVGIAQLSKAAPSRSVPSTPFNTKPTSRRIYVPFQVSLDEVKEIKIKFNVTVNDVVMAICAGGLRRWLADHDALSSQPLTAAVPVSTRTASDKDAAGNQVSMILADLPTHEADPLSRLQAVNKSMSIAKTEHGALPVQTIIGLNDLAVPAIASAAAREFQRLNLAGRMTPANVVISNVPGPQRPMYLAGAQLMAYHPASMLVDGQALNITVHSYNGSLDFGLIACPRAVPDLQHLADYIQDEHHRLLDVARQ
jgi:diacylglycerol O-acyltransferase